MFTACEKDYSVTLTQPTILPASSEGSWAGMVSHDYPLTLDLSESNHKITGIGNLAGLSISVLGENRYPNITLTISSPVYQPAIITAKFSDPFSFSGVLEGSGFNNATAEFFRNQSGPLDSLSRGPILISPKTVFGFVGQKFRFIPEIDYYNSNLTPRVIWISKNALVASVDEEGLCDIKSKGITLIIARLTSPFGITLGQSTAYLFANQVSLSISMKELRLATTQDYKLSTNSVQFPTFWSSSDPSVATVDPDGLVHAKRLGAAKITVLAKDDSGFVLAKDSAMIFVEWSLMLALQDQIATFALHPFTNRLAVGARGGVGVLMSDDGGNSWTTMNSGLQLNSSVAISVIAQSSTAPDYLMSLANGIYTTENAGTVWRSTPIPDETIVSLAINPTDDQTAYALQLYNKLFKTTNRGNSWTLQSNPPGIPGLVPGIFIDPLDTRNMYIGGHGSYRSTDAGYSWSAVTWLGQGPENAIVNIDSKGRVYIQDYNWDGSLKLRLLQSNDHGISWLSLKEYTLDGYPFVYGSEFVTAKGLCIASSGQIFISSDAGQTWETIQRPTVASGQCCGVVVVHDSPFESFFGIGTNLWKYRKILQ
jgi:photosystem II stability/assembly factor-like uncharacterized protein